MSARAGAGPRPSAILAVQALIALAALAAATVGVVTSSPKAAEPAEALQALQTRSFRFSWTHETIGTQVPGLTHFGSNMVGGFDATSEVMKATMNIEFGDTKFACNYIASGDKTYIETHPEKRAELGAKWVSVSTDAAAEASGFPSADRLEKLSEGLLDDFDRTGTSEVRGTPVTIYRGHLDQRSMFDGPVPQEVGAVLPESIPTEIYVDDDELPRRVVTELTPKGGVGFRMIMDFYDFGAPLTVKAPDASATKDVSPDVAFTACFPASMPG